MADILNHPSKAAQKRSAEAKAKFGDDEWLLKLCAEWRATRAQQQVNWAQNDAVSLWGHLDDDDVELDLAPLHRMQEIEELLADMKPRSVLMAREMLRMCVTILAHQAEDPEATLSQGPVLDIVRNVAEQMGYLDGETRLGK